MCVSGQVLPAHVPVQRGGGRGAEDGDHRQEEHAHGQEGRHVLLGHVAASSVIIVYMSQSELLVCDCQCCMVSVFLAVHFRYSEGSAAALARCKHQIQFLWDPIS